MFGMSMSTMVMIGAVIFAVLGWKGKDTTVIGWLLSLIQGKPTPPGPSPSPVPSPNDHPLIADILSRIIDRLTNLERAVVPLDPEMEEDGDPSADDFLFDASRELIAEERHDDAAAVFKILSRRTAPVSGDPPK